MNEEQIEEKQIRNRKIVSVVLAILVFTAIIAAIVISIIELNKTAIIVVTVAPSDSVVKVNNMRLENGEHKVFPGKYEVSVTKDGFDEYTESFELAKGEKKTLLVCLSGDNAEAWYIEHDADAETCQWLAQEKRLKNTKNAEVRSDKIWETLPYRNYERGFYISPITNDDEMQITGISITAFSCNQSRIDSIIDGAKSWLQSKGIDISKYEIVTKSSCGDSN